VPPKTASRTDRAALGFRSHSGWAALVAVGGPVESPSIVLRTRIELADPRIEGSKQPYHAAEDLELHRARQLIERCIARTSAMAAEAVDGALADLRAAGHDLVAAGLLLASGRPLPALEAILASHALIHTAEGEMYREALRQACRAPGLALVEIKEREVGDLAAAGLGASPAECKRRLDEWGRALGPPWTQDEKLSALAAWLALARATGKGSR
jgi:hypothetical protein